MSHRTDDPPQGGRKGKLYLLALAAALGGLVVLFVALYGQRSAPQPAADQSGQTSVPPVTTPTSPKSPSPGTTDTSPPPSTPSTTSGPTETVLSLPPSMPTSVSIPALNLHSEVISIGKNPDGTLAVPQPGPNLDKVAWYHYSATPGAPGPSVLEGHVDTTQGPSIFYRLGALHIGDRVSIARADGSTAVFTVNAVRQYATHADFPVQQIFADQLTDPTLRLITCSNFDGGSGHYLGNTVVFAHLTAVYQA